MRFKRNISLVLVLSMMIAVISIRSTAKEMQSATEVKARATAIKKANSLGKLLNETLAEEE